MKNPFIPIKVKRHEIQKSFNFRRVIFRSETTTSTVGQVFSPGPYTFCLELHHKANHTNRVRVRAPKTPPLNRQYPLTVHTSRTLLLEIP